MSTGTSTKNSDTEASHDTRERQKTECPAVEDITLSRQTLQNSPLPDSLLVTFLGYPWKDFSTFNIMSDSTWTIISKAIFSFGTQVQYITRMKGSHYPLSNLLGLKSTFSSRNLGLGHWYSMEQFRKALEEDGPEEVLWKPAVGDFTIQDSQEAPEGWILTEGDTVATSVAVEERCMTQNELEKFKELTEKAYDELKKINREQVERDAAFRARGD